MAQQSSEDANDCLLVYDGQCRMCVTAKNGLEQLGAGSKVRMIPYQSEEAKEALGSRHQPGRPDAAFLVYPDGRVAVGLDAFLPLLRGLKGGQCAARLLALPVIKPVGHLLYRLIARYRYRLFGEVPLKKGD